MLEVATAPPETAALFAANYLLPLDLKFWLMWSGGALMVRPRASTEVAFVVV